MLRPLAFLLTPLIFLVTAVSLTKCALKGARERNELINHADERVLNSIQNLIPPSEALDPAYQPIFYTFIEQEIRKSYLQYITQIQQDKGEEVLDRFGIIHNSEATNEVLDSIKAIRDVTGSAKFRSLYELSAYLIFIGRNDLEYKCLEFYARKHIENDKQALDHSNRCFTYLCYLQKYYIIPIDFLIRQRQFERAKYLAVRLIERLKLIDTSALNITSVDNFARINNAYLLNLLLSDLTECYRAAAVIDSLIPTFPAEYSLMITNGLQSSQKHYETSRLSEGTSEEMRDRFTISLNYPLENDPNPTTLIAYKTYWKGILKFREKQFADAELEFQRCLTSTPENILMKNLSMLWLARCQFWNYHENKTTKKLEVVSNLKDLKRGITQPNLKSDVDDYITHLTTHD